MRILLDTHALLWSLGRPATLGLEARMLLEDGRNEVFVSPVSAWEVAIKRALGKLDARGDLAAEIEKAAFVDLPITIQIADQAKPHRVVLAAHLHCYLPRRVQGEGIDVVIIHAGHDHVGARENAAQGAYAQCRG